MRKALIRFLLLPPSQTSSFAKTDENGPALPLQTVIAVLKANEEAIRAGRIMSTAQAIFGSA
jgi:hypothetical protein